MNKRDLISTRELKMLKMRFVDNLQYKEIGKEFDLTENNTHRIINKATSKLKRFE